MNRPSKVTVRNNRRRAFDYENAPKIDPAAVPRFRITHRATSKYVPAVEDAKHATRSN